MSWNFEQVAGPFSFTEGPAWDGERLLFTDIPNSRIMCYDPRSGSCAEYLVGSSEANGLLFGRDGRLFACQGAFAEAAERDGRRVVRYAADGTLEVIADRFEGKQLNSPNDLAFDAQGRMWFTDPRYGDRTDDLELDHQSVYRCDLLADGTWNIDRAVYDTTKPNGLLISIDDNWLYVAQSEYGEGCERELRAYPIAPDGSVGSYDVLHNFYPHRGIDGMCLDVEGYIIATAGWSQSGPGSMIYVFEPNGRVVETHPLPALPTNCTWGDEDLRSLYVTAGGSLYRARTERRGHLVFPN